MRIILIVSLIVLMICNIEAQDKFAEEILNKSDKVLNAPQDQSLTIKLVLVDENSEERIRKIHVVQKGDEKRLFKFLSPADYEGIGFLDLPDDLMYLYLPAFKKVRQIAGHIKNQKFAGTDFTYDDLSTINYSEKYYSSLLNETDEEFTLSLKPKNAEENNYDKLVMIIKKENYYPVRIEYYDKNGEIIRIAERRNIQKVKNYWISMEFEVHDLLAKHKTISFIEEYEYDTGLSDKLFTKRNLKR